MGAPPPRLRFSLEEESMNIKSILSHVLTYQYNMIYVAVRCSAMYCVVCSDCIRYYSMRIHTFCKRASMFRLRRLFSEVVNT